MRDFFISYNSADRDWAEWIAWQLEDAGYTAIIQAWDFGPGRSFVDDMDRALREAGCLLAVLSPDYCSSSYCAAEWQAAFRHDPTGAEGKLLPVRVADFDVVGLLGPLVYVDCVGKEPERVRAELLAAAKGDRRKPPGPPAFPTGSSTAPTFPGRAHADHVFHVPHRRNVHFTGREDELHRLRQALTSGKPMALTQTLRGLGGVGKTQLAAEYAYRHRDDYAVVWWVRAEEPTALASDYAGLAEALGLPQWGAAEQESIVGAVRSWLETHEGWLLILDNAEEIDVVEPYLPRAHTGHVIITSRNQRWRDVAQSLPVVALPLEAALDFLVARTGQGDCEAARALAEELGCLPLALEQAGAYIARVGLSVPEYLARLREQHQELLDRAGPPRDYAATVRTTWEVSLQAVEEECAASVDLLSLCAFLAPDDIPLWVITAGAASLPERLARAAQDPLSLDEAIAALRHFSLAERHGEALGLHRLVQVVVRDRLSLDEARTWAEAAVRCVDRAFPEASDDWRTWSVCAALLPHGLVSADHAESYGAPLEPAGRVLNQAALYLHGRAESAQARALHEREIAWSERTFGPDHHETATSLSNLATVLNDLGDARGAAQALERALAIDEKALGPDHPNVARDLSNLAVALDDLGDLLGARQRLERALSIDERAFGSDHPKVAVRLNNLALVFRGLGELAEARERLERSLVIDERALGADHPNVATRLSNLASVLQELGDLPRARAMLERALQIRRAALGDEHPHTQSAQRKLAGLGGG